MKKVLIMSLNPISDYNNMGKTMLGLFSEFAKEELCQFYVFPSIPNLPHCKSFFRQTDKETACSILHRGSAGRIVSENEICYQNSLCGAGEAVKLMRLKRSSLGYELKILLRDTVWNLSPRHNKRLIDWLKAEKPDVIFAAPGACGFFYRLVEQTATELHIPIVTYVCDDYYFCNQDQKGLICGGYARYIRRHIRRLMQRSAHVVTICDELAHDYAQEFGCTCTTISTGANIPPATQANPGTSQIVSYFGNLTLGRYQSLATVARMIDAYNAERGANVELRIHTMNDTPAFRAAFEGIRCAHFCGYLPSDKVYENMRSSALLFHIESFEKSFIEKVKYSVSTKIADTLSSGTCLFAYGPAGVASMEHLRKHACAATAFNEQELREKLFACLSDEAARRAMADNALGIAATNHNAATQSKLLKSVLKEAVQ